jgi:sodium/potassium/calcium exchanger 6
MLLGIGISTSFACVKNGGTFPVTDQTSHQLAISGSFLLLSLLSSATIVPLNRCERPPALRVPWADFLLMMMAVRWRSFKVTRRYGIYLWGLYATYLVTAVALEFTSKQDNS